MDAQAQAHRRRQELKEEGVFCRGLQNHWDTCTAKKQGLPDTLPSAVLALHTAYYLVLKTLVLRDKPDTVSPPVSAPFTTASAARSHL